MKTIFITGVNRGIGYSLAQIFLANDWKVIGSTRKDTFPLDLLEHENFQHQLLDILKSESIEKMRDNLKDQPLDVVLNNAGVFDAPSLESKVFTSLEDIARVYLVNTAGPYLVAESLVSNLEMGSEKLVVSISSILGTHV